MTASHATTTLRLTTHLEAPMARPIRSKTSDSQADAATAGGGKKRNAVHIRSAEGRAASIEAQRAATKVLTERYYSRPNR